jgi:hypothetical protein
VFSVRDMMKMEHISSSNANGPRKYGENWGWSRLEETSVSCRTPNSAWVVLTLSAD